MSVNKVRIVNFNLHNKFVVDDGKDFDDEGELDKFQLKMRERSPEETLKKLIKKGLVYYVNPFLRPQSSITKNKENLFFKETHESKIKTSLSKSTLCNKSFTSESAFICSKNHETGRRNTSQNFRVKTEIEESPSNYFYKKRNEDQKDMEPAVNAFREFRNISQQTVNRINIENERRSFKLTELKKYKYDNLWKKHTFPEKINSIPKINFISRVQK